MPKPWAKYQIGFINHRKFLTLNGNAICLWIEGKDYTDAQHTDGLLPEAVVKHFRFYSKKAATLLMTSAGRKDATSEALYQPLWSAVDGFGWKMHDYLEHNDSREVVEARLAQLEADRAADRERKANARAAKRIPLSGRTSGRTRSGQQVGHEADSSRNPGSVHEKSDFSTEYRVQSTEEEKNKCCAEASSALPLLAFPIVGPEGPVWTLSEHQGCEWVSLFPGVDVLAECRKAIAWVQAHPERRKTARGMLRFLVGWLSRATDRGGTAGTGRGARSPVMGNTRIAGLTAGSQAFLNRSHK